MKETQELKRLEYTGYRLEDNETYSLVDFETGEVLDTMDEVSILFDGTTILKHGHPNKVNWRSQYLRKAFTQAGIEHDIHLVSGKIPIDELDKILTLTGYLIR